MRDHEGGTLDGLDDLGHRVGLARAGDPFQGLPSETFLDAPREKLDSLGLVARGLVGGRHPKWAHDR